MKNSEKMRPSVLLVEDEPGLQKATALLLEFDGYQVVTANNGIIGLKRLKENQPDLIMTDYMMPHMDGLSMIREIRNDPRYSHLPILIMSGAKLDPEAIRASGATTYMPKSCGWPKIRELLPKLLSEPEVERRPGAG